MDFGFNSGTQNPFTAGLLAMVAAQDPGAVASAASSVGIPPPQPNAGQNPMDLLSQFMTPSANPAAAAAAPGGVGFGGGGAGAAPNPAGILQALQGFKGPAQAQPIMSAGVSGSQKAPDPTNNAGAGNSIMQLIQQMMGGKAAAPQVPNVGGLGQYIGA